MQFRSRAQSHSQNTKGFTLVETMVSLSVFMIVLVVAVGSLVSLIDANRKARSQRLVSDNLSTSLETMSRTIREGSDHVITNAGHTITLTALDGSTVVYTQTGNQINRTINGGTAVALTSPEIIINDLTFSTVSFGGGSTEQEKIRITVSGVAGNTLRTMSDFNIQTLVTKRYRSIGLPSGGGSVSCTFDLALVMDISGSLNDTEFGQGKNALNTILNNITISPIDANVALIGFGTNGAIIHPISSNGASLTTTALNYVRTLPQSTNLPAGVILAKQQLAAGRVNAPDVIMIFTDGVANKCSDSSGNMVGTDLDCSPPYPTGTNPASQSIDELKLAKDAAAFVYVVGVGVPNSTLGANYAPYNGMTLTEFLRDEVASAGGYAAVDNYGNLQDEVATYNCQFFGGAPRPIDIAPF